MDAQATLARQFQAAIDRYTLRSRMQSAVEPYAKKPAKGQKEFQWITIGGHEAEGKQHVGGTPVQIDGSGKIVKGPDELKGGNVESLGNTSNGGKPTDLKSRIRDFLADGMNRKLSDIRRELGHPGGDHTNPANKILAEMRAAGEISVHEPRFGEPSFWMTDEQAAKAKENPAENPKSETSAQKESENPKTPAKPPESPKPAKTPDESPDDFSLTSPNKPLPTYDDDINQGKDPRQAADDADKAAEDSQYEFARPSAIKNAGEDLKGSARHKRNQWKSLEEAEADGTAEEMVNRKNLLLNEPPDLMVHAEKNPLGAVAMFLTLNRFPAEPGPGNRGRAARRRVNEEEAKKDRRQYVEAYQSIKAKAEELAAGDDDPVEALKKMSSHIEGLIKQFRGQSGDSYMAQVSATDRYNNTANRLVDLYKATNPLYARQKTNIARKTLDWGKEDHESIREAAKDVLEGKPLGKGPGKKKGYINPSDMYVNHAERKGGKDVSQFASNPNKATKHIVDDWGFRGVQWGNSVTDDERQHHAARVVEAFTDLADALKLPPQHLSLDGKLGIAIGARGRAGARAHYEPDSKVINLTRKSGVGSLAHEWGHGFDHLLNDFGRMMSETGPHETTIENGKRVWKNRSEDPLWSAMDNWKKSVANSGFQKRLADEVKNHIEKGLISEKKAGYWKSNTEVFARSFERWIQRTLEKKGQDNTYLVGFKKRSSPLWPTDAEVDAMAPQFEALIDAYKKKHNITESYSRSQIRSYFQGQVDRMIRVQTPLVDAFDRAFYAHLPLSVRFDRVMVEYYARNKPAKGQKAFAWNESDHPRDEKGQFSESEDSAKRESSKPKEGRVKMVQAPAGGKVSDVDGKFYKGGQWMPVHGLSQKSEKPTQKSGKQTGASPVANENKKPPTARQLSPEQIAEQKEQRERESQWRGLQSSPIGKLLDLRSEPHHVKGSALKTFAEHAADIGEEGFQKLASAARDATIEQQRKDNPDFNQEDVDHLDEDVRYQANLDRDYYTPRNLKGKLKNTPSATMHADGLGKPWHHLMTN